MKDEILRQQKMLCDINTTLENLKAFLIGNIAEEKSDVLKEECFLDTIKVNNNSIEKIKTNLDVIQNIIMGGNN